MTRLMLTIAYMIALILLPIIPAYLLFRALPSSTAAATGPLQGLQIKLGGAFAGYIIVLLLISRLVPPPPFEQAYTLRGSLRLAVDSTASPSFWKHLVSFSVQPPNQEAYEDGSFEVTFPYEPNSDNRRYPIIEVSASRCGVARIPIPGPDQSLPFGVKQYKMRYRPRSQEILLEEPVVLRTRPTPAARDSALLLCTQNS